MKTNNKLEYQETITDVKWLIDLLLGGTEWPIVKGVGMVTYFLHDDDDINVLRAKWIEHKNFKQMGAELGKTGAAMGERYRRALGRLYRRINRAIKDYIEHAEVVAENERLKAENAALLHRFNSLSQPEKEKFGEVKFIGMSIEDMDLSVRAYNCCKSARINNISELLDFTPYELLKFRNFGRKSLVEIEEKLAAMGYSLADERV